MKTSEMGDRSWYQGISNQNQGIYTDVWQGFGASGTRPSDPSLLRTRVIFRPSPLKIA